MEGSHMLASMMRLRWGSLGYQLAVGDSRNLWTPTRSILLLLLMWM